jgi:predicted anti-sigma-YlaC factor YlaD
MSEHTDRPTQGGDSERQHTAGAFDIRTLIAMLIGIYGVILLVVGIVNSSDSDLAKSDGININLWTGIALIVVAAGFEAWAMLRPVVVPSDQELREQKERQAREQGQG